MFEVGDIIHMKFGGTRMEFYILEVNGGFIKYCSPNWCVSGAEWEPEAKFNAREPVLISHGKRTVMSFVPFIGVIWPRYKRK